MVVGRMVVTGHIVVAWSDMEDCWTLRIVGGIDIGNILVLVMTDMMINIIIILTRGVIGDTF